MAVKKTGLGKGLDALFSTPVIDETPQEGEVVKMIKLTEIEPNKNQARKKFDEEALEELANSIKQYGVIQPIIVTQKGDYYQIVAGERRWRASKKAGQTEIPAIIRDYSDEKNKSVISLIENVQRADLNPIEKARGIKLLMEEHNMTQKEIADKLGKSRVTITNSLRILNLDQRVINLALEGKLSEGHCRTLLAIEDPDRQYKHALYMIESGDSVREAEKRMNLRKNVPKKVDEKYLPIYRDIENTFQGFFGTKVKLNAGAKKGKIVIQYDSNEDLERILGLLK